MAHHATEQHLFIYNKRHICLVWEAINEVAPHAFQLWD